MPKNTTQGRTDSETRAARVAAIAEFAGEWLTGANQDLYGEILVTLCRMARNDASRGDAKLLHKAFQELRYGFKVFAPWREIRKVSIFGSARTREDAPAYKVAEQFARKMCENDWMVITGAGDGIMKAGHGGAGVEKSFGVAIRLPFEQSNTIIADDPKLVTFRYFFTRKLMFMKESHAVVLFPGGFGTHDEGYEALVLMQTGKAPIVPMVMLEPAGGSFWQHWRGYVTGELLRTGMISENDMSLFHVTDDIDDAVREIQRFYRIYHSQRYVNGDLILRLNRSISSARLDRLNGEYSDLLESGAIEACDALPKENGEYESKPRLRMRFNRQRYGRLRQLIDAINRDGE